MVQSTDGNPPRVELRVEEVLRGEDCGTTVHGGLVRHLARPAPSGGRTEPNFVSNAIQNATHKGIGLSGKQISV